MRAKISILGAAVAIGWIAAATLSAQSFNPPYLREMPSAERVKAEMKGADPIDTAARQAGAFWQLRRMIYDLALTQHRSDRQTTPDEQRIANGYYASYNGVWQPIAKTLEQDRPRLFKLEGYATHPDILKEILERFFSPAFRDAYHKAMGDMDARIKTRQDADPMRVKPSTSEQSNSASQPTAQPSGIAAVGAAAYKSQGDAYYNAKDYPRAAEAYKQALALDQTLTAAYYDLGVVSILLKQYPDANVALKQYVTRKPNDALAVIMLGITYRELAQYPEAAIAFQAAIRLKPDAQNLANAYYHLGATYALMRNKTAALQVYSALQGIDPPRAQQLAELINKTKWESPQPSAPASAEAAAYYEQGVKFFEAKEYGKSIEAYKRAIAIKRDYFLAWHGLGSAYVDSDQNAEGAAAYKEAIRLKSDNPGSYYGLGLAYYGLKQYSNALGAFQEAIRLKPDAETYYWIGETYRTGLKDHEKALSAYRESLNLRPNDARTMNEIGLVYMDLEQYPNSVTAFQAAIRLKPAEALYYSNLGITYVRAGKKDEARQVYKTLLTLDKAKAQALFALIEKPNTGTSQPGVPVNPQAQAFFDQGQKFVDAKEFAKAVEAFKKGLAISPATVSAQINLGAAYYDLGQFENALAAFQQAIRLTPNDANPHAWVGLSYAALEQYENAIIADREAVRLAPKDHAYYFSLGNACLRAGRFLDSAAAYQQAVRLKPDESLYQYYLGFAYVIAGKKAEAMQVYNTLLKVDKDYAKDLLEDINEQRGPAAVLAKYGQIHSLTGDDAEALAAFRNALRFKPTNVDVLFDIGLGFSLASSYEEALAVYRSIIAMNPDAENLSSAYYAMGSDYYDMKDYPKALTALQQARRIKPSHLQSDKMGQVYVSLKQDQNALAAFQDSVRLKPDYGDGYLHLGQTYKGMKQYDKALVALQEAARLSPKDSRPHYEMGSTYFLQGQYPSAVAEFSEAIRIFPKHAMAHFGLGHTYRMMGKKDEALKVYATLKPIDAKLAEDLLNGINQMK